MAKFSVQQAADVASIQQLINKWALELDLQNGQTIANVITEDCVYHVGPAVRRGRAEIEQFYKDRLARLSATPKGVPIHRHMLSNLLVNFTSSDTAAITFNLVYFSTLGMASGTEHADPAAYADVKMECRRDAGGDWRISMFNSAQSFRRVLPQPK